LAVEVSERPAVELEQLVEEASEHSAAEDFDAFGVCWQDSTADARCDEFPVSYFSQALRMVCSLMVQPLLHRANVRWRPPSFLPPHWNQRLTGYGQQRASVDERVQRQA